MKVIAIDRTDVQPHHHACTPTLLSSIGEGVRDIAMGLVVIVLMIAGATRLVGCVILAATIIPVVDASIVLRNDGSRWIAWGVHGVTAAVMLVTSALLLVA